MAVKRPISPRFKAYPGLGFKLIILVLVTLLFAEWMWPLLELTETVTVYPFLLFFVAAFLTGLLGLPRYLDLFGLSLLLFYLTHRLHFDGPFFSVEWFLPFALKLLEALPVLVSWDWQDLSADVRTFFFFILIWLIALSLHQNILVRGRVLFFVVMTIGYLAVLDTFTPYDARLAVLRAVTGGFLLLAMVRYKDLIQHTEDHTIQKDGKRAWKWGLASLAFIILSVSVAYAAPKFGPSWPNPIPFLKGTAQGSSASVQKVGYGQSDEVLGGPFQPDDSVAFEATVSALSYWRGEAKDYYNGRGWETRESKEWIFPIDQFANARQVMKTALVEEGIQGERIEAQVQYRQNRPQVFYPGDLQSVQVTSRHDVVGGWNENTGRLRIYQRNNQRRTVEIDGYTLESVLPVYSVKALKEADSSQIPEEILRRYTQLPDSLPERVGALAREIVLGKENMYEKVKAIEDFFRMNGFVYETRDVPIPEEGQDYVDQFLFETRRGYCDNFSTAMVVMLRTLDIPARWVKGFTSGRVEGFEQGTYKVTVENNHAHSWVEVYFPGVGWVPFEPTVTFQNPAQFETDDEEELSVPAEAEVEMPDDWDELTQEELGSQDSSANQPGLSANWLWLAVILLVLSAIIILFARFLIWRKLLLTWAIWRYRKQQDHHLLLSAYAFLMRYLGRFVQPREPSQTLREYVQSLESRMAVENLKPLTRWYEETRFGKKVTSSNRMKQLYRLCLDVFRQLRAK